jgi:hypothetical protein
MQYFFRKIIVFLVCAMFLNGISFAATVTWTGGGADNLASTSENWSGNKMPENGDDVIYDSTAKNSSWDLTVALNSLMIKSGYSGKVTILQSINLVIEKNIFIWTGGALNDHRASNPDNWSSNQVPQNDDRVVFNGTSAENCSWDITTIPALFSINSDYTGTVISNKDLSIGGSLIVAGGSLNLNNKDLDLDGDFIIYINGTVYAGSSTLSVKGDWKNSGSFDSGTSTVILNGINQKIYSNNTFFNLIKTVSLADKLYFEAGKTQTILNNFILQGESGNLLSLRSTSDGGYWYLDPQGTRSISFVYVTDLYNPGTVDIVATNSSGSANNVGIRFDEEVCN